MRQSYETDQDLIAEDAIIKIFAKSNPVKKLPSGPRYSIDFAIQKDGRVVAVAEVKDRPTWNTNFNDVFLGLSKVKELFMYHQMGLKAFFVVRLTGDVYWVEIDDRVQQWRLTWSGRADRGDLSDTEPCVHIPFEDFTRVEE